MKKRVSCILLIALILMLLPQAANADTEIPASGDGVYLLPEHITTIEDEAFMGNTALSTLVIPNTVEQIGSKAFSNCSNLTEVFFGNSATVQIAKDAFDSKENLIFYAWPETPAELYAYSHGLNCEIVTTGSSIYERAMGLVANHGGSVTWQSGDFAAQRLIIKRSNGRLPDISAFNPSEIIRDGDIYIVQFDSETLDNVQECYASLINAPYTEWIETDKYNSIATYNEVSAAGVVDETYWDSDDPMGFDVYAPFVTANSNEGITIAVLDTGIKRNASYASKLRADGINMLARYDQQDWTADFANHGSYIAGIIADCVGDANVSILPVRILTAKKNYQDEEETFSTTVGLGIKYAVEHGAKIINLSQNFKESAYVTEKINEAISNGVIVVVSAGNNRRPISSATFPANLPGVVTVAGLDRDYLLSGNTNYGNNVGYCAPDTKVTTSAYPGWTMPGTSFSAPMIASALALVELDPYHTVEDLNATCYINPSVSENLSSYGYGMPRLNSLGNVPVTSITLDENLPNVIGIGKADTELKWTVAPQNATNKTITVTSSAPAVLTIVKDDSSGKAYARGLSTGKATLTFKADSGISVSKEFQVVRPVESIVISGGQAKLSLTRSLQLSASVFPANATTSTVQWKSSNESIATVSSNGLVTPHKTGNVLIYAEAIDGSGAISEKIGIEIIEQPDPEEIVLKINGQNVTNGSYEMAPGSTVQINASVLPADADQEVSFSALGSYVTVSNSGLVTAVKSGTGYIQASTSNGKTASLEINVVIPPESVTISGPNTVDVGKTITLTANVLPQNAFNRSVTWESSDGNIASVNRTSGVVTGINTGNVVITATAVGNPSVKNVYNLEVLYPYTVSWSSPEHGSITVSRVSSPKANAATGAISSGTTVYYNDVLEVTYAAADGYQVNSHGVERITVSNNIGSAQIYLTVVPEIVSYRALDYSTNGTYLGVRTITGQYGTSSWVDAGSYNGYSGQGQQVSWDSRQSKDIRFNYSPNGTSASQYLASGTWWKNNDTGSNITFSVNGEWQNRTANSVQVRIVWTQTIDGGYYQYNQRFYVSFWHGGNNVGNTGSKLIADTEQWRWSTRPNHGSVTVNSDWITVPLNTTGPTSVICECDWAADDSETMKGSWGNAPIAIPAY